MQRIFFYPYEKQSSIHRLCRSSLMFKQLSALSRTGLCTQTPTLAIQEQVKDQTSLSRSQDHPCSGFLLFFCIEELLVNTLQAVPRVWRSVELHYLQGMLVNIQTLDLHADEEFVCLCTLDLQYFTYYSPTSVP